MGHIHLETRDDNIRQKALRLVAEEKEPKYQKKYAQLLKTVAG